MNRPVPSLNDSHLCKSCHGLVLTQCLIKEIPESRISDFNVALDLSQGFIDLPVKKLDTSPLFPGLKSNNGCEFCAHLHDALTFEAEAIFGTTPSLPRGDVIIKFRYNCAPELGLVSFDAGHWHTHLSALEALIYYKSNPNSPTPYIVVFKLHTGPRMYCTLMTDLFHILLTV